MNDELKKEIDLHRSVDAWGLHLRQHETAPGIVKLTIPFDLFDEQSKQILRDEYHGQGVSSNMKRRTTSMELLASFVDKVSYGNFRTEDNHYRVAFLTPKQYTLVRKQKKEKNLRQYKDTDELKNDFCERMNIISDVTYFEPCIWIRKKPGRFTPTFLIVGYYPTAVLIAKPEGIEAIHLARLSEDFVFKDGTPIGITE